MDNALQLSTQLKQAQRLTPLQMRYSRMLEMDGAEVEDEVRREIDENPALEVVDEPVAYEGAFGETAEDLRKADYSDDEMPPYRLEAHNGSNARGYTESVTADDETTLMDSLMDQIRETTLDETDRKIAQYIIGNLDDNGYLQRDVQSMSNDMIVAGIEAATPETVRRIWGVVRGLEPAGVGAVDLRDAMLLQLRRKPSTRAVETAKEIVNDYFDLLGLKHYDRLRSLMGIDERELKDALDVIKTLNPKPGGQVTSSLAEERSRQITPEFGVEADGDRLTVSLLNAIPTMRVSESFDIASENKRHPRSQRDRDEALFIRQKRDDAANFIKMIELRQATLLSVMTAIAQLQRDFFITGDKTQIKPMILKDVAELADYDLSVISRATSGKYVETQYGVFPLKMFFNERSREDDNKSTHQIEAALRELIASEDKRRPLTDAELTEAMAARGFDMARRTVAKYREKLGIAVARLRKEM